MVELGKVARRPLEVARAGGLRRAAVAVVGAVRSAVHSGVRGEAGGLGWGVGETRVEAVVWGVGRARAEPSYRLSRAAGRWGEKRPRERLESREWRAHSQRRQPPRRRRPKGRAPARELQAGWAPSDPQGAGCRDTGPRRGYGGASRATSGRSRGLGSLTLPGAPCLPGVERPSSRGTRAIEFGAGATVCPSPTLLAEVLGDFARPCPPSRHCPRKLEPQPGL